MSDIPNDNQPGPEPDEDRDDHGEVMTLWNQQQLGPRYQNVQVFTRDARQAFKRITGESLRWEGR